jgi:uncharacterized protein (UPF0261 family)
MKKRILILATLDTKAEETEYLRQKIEDLGVTPLLMDLSLQGSARSPADITPEQIAEAAGTRIETLRSTSERSKITNTVIKGASRLAVELYGTGKIHGIIALGGSTGSLMATEAMRALPFGPPKLMISSTAALPGLSTRYMGTGDILLFHSVIEVSGLTAPLMNVMDRAACAMAAMVKGDVGSPKTTRAKAIAMTMLGPCEKCASTVRAALEGDGYQVIGFSAAGIGDRAMEEMISQGFFQGVIDLAPGGVGEHHFGFMRDAGPKRLESAGLAGIPQIISTCSVNHMTPAKSRYKPEYHQRRKYDLDKYRTWLRLSPEQLDEVAAIFAAKLNRATGPVKILVPLRGWSSVDSPGNPTYDPAEDRGFVEALKRELRPEIVVREVDAHMEEPAFAKVVIEVAREIFV